MQPGRERPAAASDSGSRRAFFHGETLARRQRLLSPRQFEAAYAQNRRCHGRCMVLFLLSGPGASLRLGVVASKKVGNAVERARAKRRLREAFRRNRARFTNQCDDVVLVARRAVLDAPWSEVVAELIRLGTQAGLAPAAAP